MIRKLSSRLYTALLIPRTPGGYLDEDALAIQMEFLLKTGIRNVVVNGATGEYCLTSPSDLGRCLRLVREVLPPDAGFLCGVGSPSLQKSLELGRMSIDAGVEAILVPMPHFFPYSQTDLMEFVGQVATELPARILLYNLPRFTSGLEVSTVIELMKQYPNIIGIKDSSGSLDIFRAITEAEIDSLRISGNDLALPDALAAGLCDGVVSGIACVLPELIQMLLSSIPGSEEFQVAREKLIELVAYVDVLPCPWGLKALAEARGIAKATYHQPLSLDRKKQMTEFQNWFNKWVVDLADTCSLSLA